MMPVYVIQLFHYCDRRKDKPDSSSWLLSKTPKQKKTVTFSDAVDERLYYPKYKGKKHVHQK
jgi:hypothetical protein